MSDVRKDYKAVRDGFANLIRAVGGRVANSPFDHGAYQLDRQGGGWRIERIGLNSTGVSTPFGSARLTSVQMLSHMNFVVAGIGLFKNSVGPDRRCSYCVENGLTPCEHSEDRHHEESIRLMKTIYALEADTFKVDVALKDLQNTGLVPSLDYDLDWEGADEEDDRCDYCVENKIENCRHIGM